MECVADRFVETTNGEVVDLATGERVLLRIASAGGETDQRRWMIRCDLFQKLHHPAIAILVDYGLIGEARRFEAWHCSGPWCGTDAAATDVARAATSFLEACGLTTDQNDAGAIHRFGSRPIVVPAPATGYQAAAPIVPSGTPIPIGNCGVLCVERLGDESGGGTVRSPRQPAASRRHLRRTRRRKNDDGSTACASGTTPGLRAAERAAARYAIRGGARWTLGPDRRRRRARRTSAACWRLPCGRHGATSC